MDGQQLTLPWGRWETLARVTFSECHSDQRVPTPAVRSSVLGPDIQNPDDRLNDRPHSSHLYYVISYHVVMSAFGLLTLTPDGGTERKRTHIECRECGTNLTTDTESCPDCGGGAAVYEL